MADFAGKADVLRYVLTAIMPETKDSEFTWADFQTRNNSELVGIFGNFVNRALVLLQKYHGGMVPTPGPLTDDDLALQTEVRQQAERLGHAIEQFHFRDALAALMDIARAGNKYLADQQPWHVVKHDPDRAATTLFVALQVVAALQRAASPFLPDTALKISQMLRADAVERKDYRADDFFWSNKYLSLDAANALIPAGHTLGTPALLFEKLEDSVIQAQVDKLHAKRAARAAAATPEAELAPPAIAPLKPEIQFDDFAKLDIRIGTVLAAERVPKADKLLRLTVDLGECAPDGTPAPRTIISGIAEYFAPEALVGRQMPVLANLAPRKLRGIESQGMILMADGPQGLSWLSPDQPLPSGSGVS
jgi:methionyl-tRNA synthetase